jgi:biotin-(acetyl-CoA carboxylase) ligase
VWVGDKKIAGVLTESRVDGARPAVVVVGIGINVGSRELPREVQDSATSLALLGAVSTREQLLAVLLSCLEPRLERLSHGRGEIVSELRRHDVLLGRRVAVDGTTSGTAAGVDHAGRLLVKLPSGPIVEIQSGSVEIVS